MGGAFAHVGRVAYGPASFVRRQQAGRAASSTIAGSFPEPGVRYSFPVRERRPRDARAQKHGVRSRGRTINMTLVSGPMLGSFVGQRYDPLDPRGLRTSSWSGDTGGACVSPRARRRVAGMANHRAFRHDSVGWNEVEQ